MLATAQVITDDDKRFRTQLKRIGITCVCFNLKKAGRLVTKHYDKHLADADISSTQFAILASIERHKDMTITELADLLVMDRTTLTRNLKPLEKMGWIQFGEYSDKRKRRIELTEKGRDHLRRAIPAWEKAQRTIVFSLGEDNHRKLLTYLWRFIYGKRFLDA